MEGTTITLKDLLKMEVDKLSNINVPVSYAQQISIPIAEVISDLKVAIASIMDPPVNEEPEEEESNEEE